METIEVKGRARVYVVARTVRDRNLETRSARGRLKPTPKPYYRAIDPGLHLGYRKGRNGGRWVVRLYVGAQAYRTDAIATADDVADADGVAILNFAQAQAVAREMRAPNCANCRRDADRGGPLYR